MKNIDAFSSYHPLINFLYFFLVILFAMWFIHPVCLFFSMTAAFLWSVYLKGNSAIKFSLFYMLPMILITALINPAFSHEGVTILTYLPSGNPLTLESIAYGCGTAAMLVAVILWFSCYNEVLTSDKFVYLFGRIIPALSLIFSMALRLVPKFKAQLRVISNAQKCVGRDVSNGGVIERAKHGIRILSIMITWALENAIDTADSMKSRGYGLPGRTAFSIYRFDERDQNAMCFIGGCGAYVLLAAWRGDFFWRYYPSMKSVELSVWSVSAAAVYLLLCATPLIIDYMEDRKWKRIESKI